MNFFERGVSSFVTFTEIILRKAYKSLKPALVNKRFSVFFISSSILLVTLFLVVSGLFSITKDFQETGYLLYGVPIIYAVFMYKKSFSGLKVAFLSYPFWLIGITTRINRKILEGDISDIVVESIIIPIIYFIGCVIIGKLVLRERQIVRSYQAVASELSFQNKILHKYHSDLIKTLTKAIDAKDTYTKGHSERVGCLALSIAKEMGLSAQDQRDIFYAGTLHDIGKIGVSEKILSKPSSLTAIEYSEIKNHATIGLEILSEFETMDNVKKIIYSHHERCNGSGYPLGLSSEEIPLGAKIIAVADSYDALVSNRTYQNVVSKEEAIKELISSSNNNLFEPQVTNLFTQLLEAGNIELEFNECLIYINQL